jgi:dTDP-4-dehydrorhamnose reductase
MKPQGSDAGSHDKVTALVIGASGQVGGALLRHLGPRAVGTYRSRPLAGLRFLDAHDRSSTRALLDEFQPEVVFFPAAEPNVDWCELHPDDARQANVVPALETLAETTATGAQMVFFSTDYVFDGQTGPYDEDDEPNPLSVYARHKHQIEESVRKAGGTVVRTTTVYGWEPSPGKNFVLRLVANLRKGERVTVPSDQLATPTWSAELATGAAAVAERPGIWHVAGPEFLSREGFARLIAEVFALDESLIASVPTASLNQPARRPLRGGLRTDKLRRETGLTFLPVREALLRLRNELE